MVDQFFVERGGKKAGPFSTGQLKGLAAEGRLQPTDAIWKDGMDKPVVAAKVKNLFPDPAQGAAPSEAEMTAAAHAADMSRSDADVALESPSAAAEHPIAAGDSDPELADFDVESEPPAEDAPAEPPPAEKEKPTPRVEHVPRKRRAIGMKGAIVVSQDGVYASYRKVCTECGYEDPARTNMLIGHGVTRTSFFCRKCRKSREVLVQGVQM
jgi:nitroreductase